MVPLNCVERRSQSLPRLARTPLSPALCPLPAWLAALGLGLSFGLGAARPAAAAPAPASTQVAAASPVAFEFSADLLAGGNGSRVDVSRFSLGNPQLAGTYRADVYVNGRWLQRRDVRLAGNPAVICIDADLLRLLGISREGLLPAGQALVPGGNGSPAAGPAPAQCTTLESLTRDASASFEAGELRLDITIPQASLARQPKGYVPPESWDHGITAGLLGYNLNAYRNSGAGMSSDALFLGLNGGINFDRWRLRHSGSYTQVSGSKARYTALGTFISTDLPDWQATLAFGDSNTRGQLFPTTKLRGVSLSTDERMLPDSRRGFAPVIRGVANTNARVEVRQANAVLYSTSVPPGPFEINDLYPTGYGGDLQVVVIEADGSQRTSSVPFSSLPQLLRAGNLFYSVNAGQLLNYQRHYELVQGTVQYGLSNTTTLAGGLQVSERYFAALAGSAWNTPLGALQANVTAASFRRSSTEQHSGWSLDASWAKVLPATSTNLNFAAYRYSSAGYYSLDDAMRLRDYDASLYRGGAPGFRLRNRAVLAVNQSLAGSLSFNLSATSQDYWDRRGRETSYQVGLYKQLGPAQLSVNAYSSRSLADGSTQRTYTVGLSLPLGSGESTRNNVTAFATHDQVNGNSHQVGFFGNYGERGEVSYGVSHQNSRIGNLLTANASYNGQYAVVGATASTGRGFSQQSILASGGIVAADGHLVFAPFLGETVGLVRVDGAQGLRVSASQASELDRDGYTLLPYLTPYAANTVELDVSKAPLSARFEATSATVAPHAGSVVLLNFARLSGYTLMLKTRLPGGGAVPFAASVYDDQGMLVGSVGQAGRVEAASKQLKGSLRISWGNEPEANCWVRYDLPRPAAGEDGLVQADVPCQPVQASPEPGPQRAASATVTRAPVLFNVVDTQGDALPSGAEVSLADQPDRIGIVAQGRVMMRMSPTEAQSGRLVARWTTPQGSGRSCALQRASHGEVEHAAITARCLDGMADVRADASTPVVQAARGR